MSVSITPIQSNSHILVVVTGSGSGYYGGTSSGQQASGRVTVYKNGAPWTGLETSLPRGNPTFATPISQIILDTGPAAGSSVSYQVMLKKYLGNGSGVSPSIKHSTSITLIEFMV